jgi:hypothetical protein
MNVNNQSFLRETVQEVSTLQNAWEHTRDAVWLAISSIFTRVSMGIPTFRANSLWNLGEIVTIANRYRLLTSEPFDHSPQIPMAGLHRLNRATVGR